MLRLDVNPVNPFYGHILGRNQPEKVTLEMLKCRSPAIRPEAFNGLLKSYWDIRHDLLRNTPPLLRYIIRAITRLSTHNSLAGYILILT